MLITIRNGKAELRNDNGSLVRTMGSSNVVSVSMNSNQELVGIVYASKVSSLLNIGQYDEAVAASKEAGKWVKIGFITGLIGIILYVLVVFLVIYTTDTSDMSCIDV